jgi:hypothetical protein
MTLSGIERRHGHEMDVAWVPRSTRQRRAIDARRHDGNAAPLDAIERERFEQRAAGDDNLRGAREGATLSLCPPGGRHPVDPDLRCDQRMHDWHDRQPRPVPLDDSRHSAAGETVNRDDRPSGNGGQGAFRVLER